MKKCYNLSLKLAGLLSFCFCLIVVPGHAGTFSVGESGAVEEHIPVGERCISHDEYMEIQANRAMRAKDRLIQQGVNEEDDSAVNESEELISKKVYYSSHQGVFHRPIAVSPFGDMVTLEDGSVWQVKGGDAIKTLDWLAGDSIIILPNHAWFSSYKYVLLNQNTGAKIKVNLSLGPIYNGIFTHWIVAIDYYNCELCLEDGSVWKISNSDSGTMKKWMPNDTIILGINDSWFSSKPNILINVNMLNDVAAVCEN